MRKLGFYLLGLILIAAAAAAVVAASRSSKSHVDKVSNTSAAAGQSADAKKACAIFTLADAKLLLGSNAKGGAAGNPAVSNDLSVSTCTYTQDGGGNAQVSAGNSASLLARVPKTGKGITSNTNEFGPLRPSGVQDVPGYGDSAYWDTEHGQLNILKNNAWYILSNGPIAPAGRTLDQAKQLADMLISRL